MKKYTVKIDTQEKKGVWFFQESERCAGSVRTHLKTGDYTLETFEDIFIVERKATTGELARNINEGRFKREVERLSEFKYPFIVCEFTWDDVYSFPRNSEIPQYLWSKLKVTSQYMAKCLAEYQLEYGVNICLCGSYAKYYVSNLFKRIVEINE